jgi:hypothetical protein
MPPTSPLDTLTREHRDALTHLAALTRASSHPDADTELGEARGLVRGLARGVEVAGALAAELDALRSARRRAGRSPGGVGAAVGEAGALVDAARRGAGVGTLGALAAVLRERGLEITGSMLGKIRAGRRPLTEPVRAALEGVALAER